MYRSGICPIFSESSASCLKFLSNKQGFFYIKVGFGRVIIRIYLRDVLVKIKYIYKCIIRPALISNPSICACLRINQDFVFGTS